jgi:dihydropteroate synthase
VRDRRWGDSPKTGCIELSESGPGGASERGRRAASREKIVFVTGKLAEYSLRQVVERLSAEIGFDFHVAVLPISVAALMQVEWVARKFSLTERADRVILPGWCQGELAVLADRFDVAFERGPKDLHNLPDYFGTPATAPDLSRYEIEILAEINHAPRLADAEIILLAQEMKEDGADVIDLGCVPGESWSRAGDVTRLLRKEGCRVSIDSFERHEVEAAVAAGAELVLSCNSSNADWAAGLGAEVVAIPDDPSDLDSLERTIERLNARGTRFRIDPILEPIGHGFAGSLERFFVARRRWPQIEMLMGVGNLTELTEVDSAGVNMILAGVCQELRIGSVLTTQVINWARTSVRELDIARRVMSYAFSHAVLPKHVDPRLVMLRDPKVVEMTAGELDQIASRITDPNYRIVVQDGAIHLFNRDGHWSGRDPFELIRQAAAVAGDGGKRALDPLHAFYLGYELCKAATALALGKQYTQDEPLQWGFLTVPEPSHVRRHAEPDAAP